MPKNVQSSMDKWARNTAAAGEAMKQGIQGVTESPNAKAADAQDKYAANVQAAVSSGRYAAGNRAVSLSDWKTAAETKGVPNMQNGVRNISGRAKRNMQDQLNYAQTVAQQIAGMPNTTEADAEQRMIAAMRLMRQYRKNG